MTRAKLEVELGRVQLGENWLSAKFFVETGARPFVAVIASDAEADNTVVTMCDSHSWETLDRLPATAEKTVRLLKGCKEIMPTDVISNPMTLEIEVSQLQFGDVHITAKLAVDRSRAVQFIVAFSDWDSNEFVLFRVPATEYGRLKEFFRECNEGIQSLYARRQIDRPFLSRS